MFKKKLLAIMACSVVASCSILGGVIALADNKVDVFADSYVKGQTLSIPKTVQVAGSTYSIKDAVVYSPDGKGPSMKSTLPNFFRRSSRSSKIFSYTESGRLKSFSVPPRVTFAPERAAMGIINRSVLPLSLQ